MSKILQGTVKWFNNDKGYGFIHCEGCDYFVHYSSINGPGFKSLMKDSTVVFVPVIGDKGMQANNVIQK